MDQETKKILTEGEKLKLLIEHDGWGVAYQRFSDKIMDLQFIENVDDSSPEKALIDMKARKYAVSILLDWMKNDILGAVEQHNNNNTFAKPINSIIIRET